MNPPSSPPAPLVPVALAVGLGVYLERLVPLPTQMLVALLIALAAAWLLAIRRKQSALSTLLLWCVAGTLAAQWHRITQAWPSDAIGHFATLDRTLVKLRGAVSEDVVYQQPRRPELLSGQGTLGHSVFIVDVAALQLTDRWQPVTGRVRVSVEGEMRHLTIGDGVEIVGGLAALSPAVNPGGIDFRQNWFDQQIEASVGVKSVEGITLHRESDRWSIAGMMAQARAWVRQTLQNLMPPRQAGIAQALLCGEQSALTPDQFEGYLQTGVYHVLAVSGQHLVVLCAFVGFILRFAGGDMRSRAIWLAAFVIGFTLLTGARPPVVRAAVIVLAWCLALWLRRRVNALNVLALAWIVVAMLNPSDLANTGCQLSFLAVLVLIQIIAPWYQWEKEHLSPLDRLEAELRPASWRLIYWLVHHLKWAVLTSLVIWLATMPLVIQRFHLVSPAALFLGPLLALPITFAMISGMMLVLCSGLPVISTMLASLTGWSLELSDVLVNTFRAIPYSFGYWPDVPEWWVQVFYAGLLAVVLYPGWQRWWKLWVGIGLAWLALVIVITRPDVPSGLRMTVLSVGHGTAVVLETPGGRCLLYDAGSLAGPDVAYRHVASYLWYRRRSKIDEVLLSHADLDHFNALPDLLDRFRVGMIRMTPTFSAKPDRGTQATMKQLQAKHANMTLITRGAVLEEGDVQIEVLHPPGKGPEGAENARSLVLLITYAGERILLTGDLEEPGLSQVMQQPIAPVDVLVSPHHGSRVSNTERFAAWCQPKLVISSETFPRGPKPDPYTPLGATLWRTWIHGGVTVEVDTQGVRARTQVTGRQWVK